MGRAFKLRVRVSPYPLNFMDSYFLNRFYHRNPLLSRRENKRLKDAARIKAKELIKHNDYPKTCPYCFGKMTYCDGCRMWSSTCCQDYGTCMCS